MGRQRVGTCRRSAALALALAAPMAAAQDLGYDLGGLRLGVTGTITSGALWRAQDRNIGLIGKLNVPGQQGLCTADDCMSQTGDPAPNLRLVHAAGAYSGGNRDNGDLNYDKHDIVAAATRITPTFSAAYGDWRVKLSGILFYDPVNASFAESHPNTRFQPPETSRPQDISRQFARGGELREAYVSTLVPIGEHAYNVVVGQQLINWGESILTPLNTLNTIDPPDAVLAHMPGFELHELHLPVPAVSISGDIADGLSGSAFYQFLWRGAIAPPEGSFFSTNDLVGGGRYITLGLGNFAEDPNQHFRPAGLTGLISQSSRTALALPDSYGQPRNNGQYGLALHYTSADLNDTELGAYFANYHSRLPYISVISANASCTRKVPASTPANALFAAAFVACDGFKQSFNPLGLEPLPADTMRVFTEYPQDIHLLGLSFNTNLGAWSLAGEYAYRPNMPLQIIASDVFFAGLSPAFPRADIDVPADTGSIGVNPPFTIPGHRRAVPDFVSGYRGISEIAPNSVVHGYARFRVGQFALTGIHVVGNSDNPFGANQIQVLAEVSGTQIFNLPALSQLQLQGAGDFTHYSPGADGTGAPGSQPDSLRINPTQQRSGAATAFSWGYRLAIRAQYSNVIGNISLYPTLILFHDLGGISPATIDNYVAGRKTINLALDADLAQNLGAGLQYQWFTGAGANNLYSDRDNYGFYLRYSF
ncbi:MAG: DUF1302 domain-containing protein [Stenotrophobium sp.]